MKIAVTSANGQLGSSIVKHLIKVIGKENVIGIARTPEKAKHLGIEIRKGDYNSREEFEVALQGIDAVLLLSGMDEPQKRIQQHRNVIEAAKANGVKKIVYTSIVGDEEKNAFSPVVQSNRQTELDVQNSGMEWVIGRNGIYIEPDLEYIDNYVKEGEIRNCAGEGKCAYTSREELGYAHTKMITEAEHNGEIYNLVGEAITQTELGSYINEVYNTNFGYHYISSEVYAIERKAELGDFIGSVVTGIYEGIHSGAYYVPSDFEKATGRTHKSAIEMIKAFKNK
ncbi:NAD(P)H-binding protein [Flavobacterium degerlachei]|jgi:NAD(P)H dehydrogenase (quinone)|uniref:NAD(P)H dehydrogenase (Quinone) n=1 Tax=Flavobacterium degerlachei TaxID=229203 RepID=A0A1H3EUZ1_9FLAO|nr:NAD(P)H-binding protein [Flavobacterium degerlachei]SDX82440.1 NAD(P)H dehydrogenase (quinone) [Flavobacterium degerlachei]